MKLTQLRILTASWLLLCCLPVYSEERIALLIGNSNYSDAVGRLINPENDIKVMRKALETLNFDVMPVFDADYNTMATAIKSHIKKVREKGTGTVSFIYYSGHGASDTSTGINYLIPVNVSDADEDTLWTKSLDLKSEIIERLEAQAPDAIHFVVFDACRTELQLKSRGKKMLTVEGKSFVPVQPLGPVLVAYSTAARRAASDYGVGSGPYARALSEEIIVPGVEAVSMFRSVQIRIQKSIGQNPFMSVPSLAEFYFAGRAAPGQQPVYAGPQTAIPSPADEERAFEIERTSSRRAMSELLMQLRRSGQKPGGAFNSTKIWKPGTTLSFCFENGTPQQQTYVASVASQWTLYGNVKFDFFNSGIPRKCQPSSDSNLRISLIGSNGNWAFIGTDVLQQQGRTVISLESVGHSDDFDNGFSQGGILHAFGHILGFVHAWSFPDCNSELDWSAITSSIGRDYGWTAEQLRANFQTNEFGLTRGVFDRYSVMGYDLPPKFFKKGKESSCYMEPPGQLSIQDKLAVSEAYK